MHIVYDVIFEMAKTVQVCERCLTKQSSNNHIVTHETAKCNSSCATCLDLKSVCEHCKVKGHVSYVPALRCCDSCLENAVQCKKVAVLPANSGDVRKQHPST